MPIARIEIAGFRGFATPESISLALPNGKPGSGMTIIVGANNTGKSTVIETLHFLQRSDVPPQLGDGKKNAAARGRVSIKFTDDAGKSATLGTKPAGGGDVLWREQKLAMQRGEVFVLPMRRTLDDGNFQNTEATREQYGAYVQPGLMRSQGRANFANRLVRMHNRREEVDAILAKVLDDVPEWTIEPAEQSQWTLKFYSGGGHHSGEGVGGGVASLLFLADAIYDSEPGHIIVMDEPEMSLHPYTQRKLFALLAEVARDRQVIYATHSPYFAEWSAIFNGASVARVYKGENTSHIGNLSPESVANIRKLQHNNNNPHVLGTDAREVFFLPDGIILVEGQEDVVGYQRLSEQLGIPLDGEFYGWGAGGAQNIRAIASVLRDLRFSHVAIVVDGDQRMLATDLELEFPRYRVVINPAPDVRTKPELPARRAKTGLLDEHWALRPELATAAESLLQQINSAILFENGYPDGRV
jgi:predicted ATPase